MNTSGWLQLAFFSLVLLALTKPMGLYLVRVLDAEGRTCLDPVLKPVERLIYRLAGIDPAKEQDWKGYAVSVLIFSVVGLLLTYLILRLQYFLPLNPQGFSGVAGDLAFNTAASFTTNTNWQNYGGESTLSYLSQMVGLTFHNFVSAAAGIAIAAALVRGIARDKAATLGNFWTDLTRSCLYLLLPICLVFAVFLVSQGMIQNFSGYQTARVLDPYTTQVAKKDAGGQEVKDAQGNPVMADVKVETQTIPAGPVASQVAIKMLGTNGGGFFNANAAHPFENPTPLSNFLQMLSIFLIPSGLTYYLGRMVKNQKHGWSVWAAMFLLFLVGVLVCWGAESYGNPRLAALGVDQSVWQYGRQGSALRHLQFRLVCHGDHGCLLRRGQLHARFLHAPGRAGAPVQHPVGRGGLRRRRRRPLRHAGLRGAGHLPGRPHGGAHPGIPGEKDRVL